MPGKSVASNKAQVKLDETLKKVHVKPIPKDWYDTFIETARVVCGYIKHTIGTKNGSYKFGWYDGIPNGVPTGKVTSLIPDVWDTFGRNVWNLFGGQGQKDSWNTADIFLVKNGSGDKLLADSKAMKKIIEAAQENNKIAWDSLAISIDQAKAKDQPLEADYDKNDNNKYNDTTNERKREKEPENE